MEKRTGGTGRLYQANSCGISRREFNEMVRQVRSAYNRRSASALCRIRWLRPDLSRALNGMQYIDCYVQSLQDLCSHYKFAPLTTAHMPCGEEIAGHLGRHLTRFGPPLFLKRDNAGKLNHLSINAILEELMIIRLNSPGYSTSYNGSIEHSQGELKSWIGKWNSLAKTNRELFCCSKMRPMR